MSDTIFISGVVIHARHGVMEHETEVGQRFVIDLELSVDFHKPHAPIAAIFDDVGVVLMRTRQPSHG